jgi:hypothetical protein
MKNKNLHILIMMVSAVAFQACGELPVQGGFTEETIDTSNTSLTPGIQEGICEETDNEFTFKANGSVTTYTFTKSTGIILDPNGNEYIEEQTKNAEQAALDVSYECTMDVSEDKNDIVFTPLNKSLNLPVKTVRGTALVN